MTTTKRVRTGHEDENFDMLLDGFNSLVASSPKPASIKDKLAEIRASVNTLNLNIRQEEAITARCDNYAAGNYGKMHGVK